MPNTCFNIGRGISPYVSNGLPKTIREARAIPFSKLRFDHFRDPKQKVMHWLPFQVDIDRIVHCAELVKPQGREKPVVLDIGTGTGLLACLIARTGKANVIGIDPFEPLMNNPAYVHKNLRYFQAGVEWAVENFRGEIDLAVWSWPLLGLDPLIALQALNPRGVMLIADLNDYRGTIDFVDYNRYVYYINYDKFSGFNKSMFWRSVDFRKLNMPAHRSFEYVDPRDNHFVFFVNAQRDPAVSQPNEISARSEFAWVVEAREFYSQFPSPTPVKLIGNEYVLCPEGEYI